MKIQPTLIPGTEWQRAFAAKVEDEAHAAYLADRMAWIKRKRSPNTFRWTAPEWLNRCIAAMGRNDEECAKASLMYRAD